MAANGRFFLATPRFKGDKAVPMKVPFLTWLGSVLWCVRRVIRGLAYDAAAMFAPSDAGPKQAGPPLVAGRAAFYERRLYREFQDCWNRPVAGEPGARIAVLNSAGRFTECINLGSYNYLGFGGYNATCTEACIEALRHGVGGGGEAGVAALEEPLEREIADFVGKPAALVLPMGFSTNSSGLPALLHGQGRALILSDELNHRSIVEGARASRAQIRRFHHNDVRNLETLLAKAELERWSQVWIVVEGIYSMEGDYCPLPEIVELKRRYGAYLYLDEAHSIGAVGATGRGVPERFGVDPAEVDVLVGTFSKSFAAVGGYVAASHDTISRLRTRGLATLYGTAMAPACIVQVRKALGELTGPGGEDRLRRLRENCRHFRGRLREMGAWILGNDDSPVVPMMLCNPGSMTTFSRECLREGLAVVVVGPPATPLTLGRARFCISAAHTTADLDAAIAIIERVACSVRVLGIGPEGPPSPEGPVSRLPPRRAFRPVEPPPCDPPVNDLRRFDVLGMARDPEVVSAAAAALRVYGCGTCGPRGFYGTTDAHLDLERTLAAFLGRDRCIVYPHGSAVMSSVVQAFVARGDAVFVPKTLGAFTRQGLMLSGGTVHEWRDITDLEVQLEALEINGRIFLVSEGLSLAGGELCPLPDLMRLRDRHKCHLILDETMSFGLLGDYGRGTEEHFRLARGSVDLVVGSLEVALGCVGGFCAGNTALVEHQRLSGSGYCFSASAPAFTAVAAATALSRLDRRPLAVRRVAASFHDQLVGALPATSPLRLHGHPLSPFKFLTVDGTDDLGELKAAAGARGVALYRRGLTLRLGLPFDMTPSAIAEVVASIVGSVPVAVADHPRPHSCGVDTIVETRVRAPLKAHT